MCPDYQSMMVLVDACGLGGEVLRCEGGVDLGQLGRGCCRKDTAALDMVCRQSGRSEDEQQRRGGRREQELGGRDGQCGQCCVDLTDMSVDSLYLWLCDLAITIKDSTYLQSIQVQDGDAAAGIARCEPLAIVAGGQARDPSAVPRVHFRPLVVAVVVGFHLRLIPFIILFLIFIYIHIPIRVPVGKLEMAAAVGGTRNDSTANDVTGRSESLDHFHLLLPLALDLVLRELDDEDVAGRYVTHDQSPRIGGKVQYRRAEALGRDLQVGGDWRVGQDGKERLDANGEQCLFFPLLRGGDEVEELGLVQVGYG